MKIILITVDTLRADHLGCYGYSRNTSPCMDKLAAEGVLFQNVFSTVSYTVPSHASILCGKYPANTSLFISQNTGCLDPLREITLAEVLSDLGYETAAFISSMVLRKKWGLDLGFKTYEESFTSAEINRPGELFRQGEETTANLLEWIEENISKDFFAWIHYFDVHGPYLNPLSFQDLYKDAEYNNTRIPLPTVPDGMAGGIPKYQLLPDGQGGFINDARHYLAQYDCGIRRVDAVIGSLLDWLQKKDIYDDALIILTSDHGEALGENNIFFFHGLTVTPDQVKVPLIIKFPCRYAATRITDKPVSTVDIMPTILEMAGFEWERLGLDGISLLDGHETCERLLFCENEWQRAVISDEIFIVKEKNIQPDGFTFYFDSKDVCKGMRFFDTLSGEELNQVGSFKELNVLEMAGFFADARDVNIRSNARRLQQAEEKLDIEKKLLNNKISLLSQENLSLKKQIDFYKSALETAYNSKSWKITSPLRKLSETKKKILKGFYSA